MKGQRWSVGDGHAGPAPQDLAGLSAPIRPTAPTAQAHKPPFRLDRLRDRERQRLLVSPSGMVETPRLAGEE